eukprot:5157288-Prymnesium_polylepis.1
MPYRLPASAGAVHHSTWAASFESKSAHPSREPPREHLRRKRQRSKPEGVFKGVEVSPLWQIGTCCTRTRDHGAA